MNAGRGDLKTSPAGTGVKPEIQSLAGNQTDATAIQRDKGSRSSSAQNDSRSEQSQSKAAEVEKIAKSESAVGNESEGSSGVTEPSIKEKKFSGRCRLFVGNLPNDLNDNDFQKFFEPYGEVNEVFLNAARGFGFIRLVSNICSFLVITRIKRGLLVNSSTNQLAASQSWTGQLAE